MKGFDFFKMVSPKLLLVAKSKIEIGSIISICIKSLNSMKINESPL